MLDLDNFRQLGLSEATLESLRKKGFEAPTAIQEKAIPILLTETVDLIGQAQTGTGKTAAFGLPILELLEENSNHVQALIIVPTRELCLQVAEELNSFKSGKRLNVAPIYGGASIGEQFRRLKRGVDIVVGTPGRLLDHLKRKSLDISKISYLVLDEADEMLNMGFIEDIELILSSSSPEKRVMLFSATMPERILMLAKNFMREYKVIAVQGNQLTTDLTEQIYFELNYSDKFEALCRIIDIEQDFFGLVFCRTKNDVDTITHKLLDRGYGVGSLHGDITQQKREETLRRFKNKKINVLIATDVAARGIDINNLSHVINYALPQDPESYVHRIGRTGRGGKEGVAITFVTHEEYRKLNYIKNVIKTKIRKGVIPKVDEVIKSKVNRINNDLNEILNGEDISPYRKIAAGILGDGDPECVIAALLKYSFQDELDAKFYGHIREESVDRKGASRLFVARGRRDGLTPRKLIDYLTQQVSMNERRIRDISIFDTYSFITVPFNDAELLLECFKRNKQGRIPLVTRAKKK